jgi:hypothetical protein
MGIVDIGAAWSCSMCEWLIGIAGPADGVASCSIGLDPAGAVAAFLFAGDFFFGAAFFVVGIFMPGMCMCCAEAGADWAAKATVSALTASKTL